MSITQEHYFRVDSYSAIQCICNFVSLHLSQNCDCNIYNIIKIMYHTHQYISKMIFVTFRSLVCVSEMRLQLLESTLTQFVVYVIFPRPHKISIFSENITKTSSARGRNMQNFDDLDIEGRSPSHLSEEDKEKVKERKPTRCGRFSHVFTCICALNNWKMNTSRETHTHAAAGSRLVRTRILRRLPLFYPP